MSAISGWRATADLIVVAPATADLMAKMAHGHADDLATAVLLATDTHNSARAGDEPADVGGEARRSAISRSSSPTASRRSARMKARWRSAASAASDAWRSRWRSPPPPRRLLKPQGPLDRQARAGHVGADARADRSGALHRQPLVRQAGPRHRRRRGRGRRRGDAGQRAGKCARSAGVSRRPGRERARHAGGGREGAAGRCRDLRRRGRRLARRQASAQKIKKAPARAPPNRRSSEIPTSSSTIAHRKSRPPDARDRLRGRDPERRCQREGEARSERLRLDPRQRCFAGRPASWAATATRFISSPRDGVEDWPPQSKEDVARMLVARIGRRAEMTDRASKSASRLPHGRDLPLPSYQTAHAAGLDLLAAVPADAPLELAPGERALSRPASPSRCPKAMRRQVRPRSGLAAKHGVTVLNSPGTDRCRLPRRDRRCS